MSEGVGTSVVVDSVFIAQQFERINVTLEHFGKSLDRANDKAEAQDKVIDSITKDVAELKADFRSMKEVQTEMRAGHNPVKLHPLAMVGLVLTPLLALAAIVTTVIVSVLPG